MRQAIALLLVTVSGCSTAPLADLLDAVAPARVMDVAPGRGGIAPPLDPIDSTPPMTGEPFWAPPINDRTNPPLLPPAPSPAGSPMSR